MPDPAIELDRPNDTEADRIASLIGSLPRPQDVSGIAGAHVGPKQRMLLLKALGALADRVDGLIGAIEDG